MDREQLLSSDVFHALVEDIIERAQFETREDVTYAAVTETADWVLDELVDAVQRKLDDGGA